MKIKNAFETTTQKTNDPFQLVKVGLKKPASNDGSGQHSPPCTIFGVAFKHNRL